MCKGRNCNFGIIPFSKALGRMERLECFLFFFFFFFYLLTHVFYNKN